MKFGVEEHMTQLLRGQVYLNTLAHFATLERDGLRGDPGEGLASYTQMHGRGRLDILREESSDWQEVATINTLSVQDPVARAAHAFCMFLFREGHRDALVDARNLGFGDTWVMFLDGDEFVRRVRRAAERQGFTVAAGLVGYVDRNDSGEMGPFRKFNDFDFQSEFRLLVDAGRPGALRLDVGDLSDIAQMGALQDLNRRIRVIAGVDPGSSVFQVALAPANR